MAALPASVERLRILNTSLPDSCFLLQSQSDPLDEARLAEIDLSNSSQLTSREAYRITKVWPHVTTIKLNRCINAFFSPDVLHIFDNLDRLEVLEANDALLSEWHISKICRNFRTLRRLSIAGSQLNYRSALWIASTLTKLESLDVSDCRRLHPVAIFQFVNLRPTLRFLYISISETNVACFSGSVDQLRLCMPACDIVYYSQS